MNLQEEHAAANPAAYRRTAEAVLMNALEDLNAPLSDDLPVIYRALAAGAFLFERTDRIVPFWFGLAGVDLRAFRESRHAAILRARFAAWRQLDARRHEEVA